jgi:hypothetical protein
MSPCQPANEVADVGRSNQIENERPYLVRVVVDDGVVYIALCRGAVLVLVS